MSVDLGPTVAEYKTSARGFAKVGVLMMVTLAIAAGFFAGSIGSDDPNIGGRVIMFILGLLFLMPSALGFYGLTKGRKNAVRLYQRGISISKPGSETRISFDDIANYGVNAFLVIETKAEDVVEFGLDGLSATPDLLKRLHDEVISERLVPGMLEAIAHGEAITFDDDEVDPIAPEEEDGNSIDGFVLDKNGVKLVNAERHLAWSDITDCGATEKVSSVGKGMLTVSSVFVKTKSETFKAVIEPFSDREAMVAVCKELIAKAVH